MKSIKNKKKKLLVFCLVLTMILLSSFNFNIIKGLSDDNYSTYLYNQDINVDNDKAHLLSEQSDGSNSYRNIFQSNFLFPAKLQNDMLSTSATSVFSHYSFNQFYFDNLNNDYAYKSNDNSENFIESIVPNDFEVEKGTNIVNGSLENQDSSFGKYNATYNFDDYQETESNYGNYYSIDNFENEIGNTDLDISYVDVISKSNCEVIDSFKNHNSVLNVSLTTTSVWGSIYHVIDNPIKSDMLEYYISISDNTKRVYLATYYGGNVNDVRVEFYSDGYIYFVDNTGLVNTNIPYLNNVFYHIKVNYDYNIGIWNLWIDDILIEKAGNSSLVIASGINEIPYYTRIGSHTEVDISFDGFGCVSNVNYNENDNTNPYGLQTELENNNFTINYQFGSSISIIDNLDYKNNVLNLSSNKFSYYPIINHAFIEQNNGIIEFQIKSKDVNKQVKIHLGNNDKLPITLSIYQNKFYYYDFSWIDVGCNALNNTWYNLKIYFDSTSDKWSLYINNVLYLDNIDYRTDYGSIGNINFLYFQIHELLNTIYINNIGYSWNLNYYENKNFDLIPLNDSNYNMYKRESFDISKENDDYYINPNQNILTQWTVSGYNNIDEYPDSENPNIDIYADISDINQYVEYGFNGSSINNKVITKIKVSIQYGFTWHSKIDDSISLYLYDNSELLEQKDITTPNTVSPLWSYYDFESLNLTDISEISFKIKAPNRIDSGYAFEIDCLYLRLYYYDLEFEVESETDINYIYDNPVKFDLLYSFCSNIYNNYIDISIYNYDIEQYYIIDTQSNYFELNISSFTLNESAYFRFGIFKVKFNGVNSLDFNVFIDLLSLNITYITENSNGFHEIIAYNLRYDDSDTYKGYSRFELQIHNESLKYRYSEINEFVDDYIYSWIEIDTSNITIDNIELQTHVRYGLNTLDVEIINFYYIIYINYDSDLTIEFMEQSRKELDCHKIKSSFNYTSFTKNYLNLTGIIGNYSYNVFKGCRSLYGLTSEIFHRYFTIPFFSDDIDVNIDITLPDGSISNPTEPIPPSDYYWTYETFRTVFYRDIDMNIGNWSVKFTQMKSEIYNAKHFYYPNSIDRDDLGSWKWKIKFTDAFSYTVSFNFMRNAICSIINLILLFIQWISFLLVASLSYLFMYIGTTILVFLWNTLVYSVYYVLLTVLWYIYDGLYTLLDMIWLGLVWVYENLLIPFFEWFWYEAIPWIIDFIIIILAHIITLLIYLITLGGIDYDSVYTNVYSMLREIADEIIGMTLTFLQHIDYIVLFILYYLLLCGLMYLRYIYCKARGFNNRAKQLKSSFDVFTLPIMIILDFFRDIKDIKTTINPMA